jgi:hypothetical protein
MLEACLFNSLNLMPDYLLRPDVYFHLYNTENRLYITVAAGKSCHDLFRLLVVASKQTGLEK